MHVAVASTYLLDQKLGTLLLPLVLCIHPMWGVRLLLVTLVSLPYIPSVLSDISCHMGWCLLHKDVILACIENQDANSSVPAVRANGNKVLDTFSLRFKVRQSLAYPAHANILS